MKNEKSYNFFLLPFSVPISILNFNVEMMLPIPMAKYLADLKECIIVETQEDRFGVSEREYQNVRGTKTEADIR